MKIGVKVARILIDVICLEFLPCLDGDETWYESTLDEGICADIAYDRENLPDLPEHARTYKKT